MSTIRKELEQERAGSGVPGLDPIVAGGYPRGRMYLVTGNPGAGKTTLALQFLMEGARLGEPALYVLLSETRDELEGVARSHGWSLQGIEVCDLQRPEDAIRLEASYTVFHPADVELTDTTKTLMQVVDRVKPRRVVFDSLAEMRLLARDPLRFRRQVLALKQYFKTRGCTVILLDSQRETTLDEQVEALAHGVIVLESFSPTYGGQRRRLQVRKLRGTHFRDGYHDFAIAHGGVRIFPRLAFPVSMNAEQWRSALELGAASSGIEKLDHLLGGGLDRGTSTLIMGPAGAGKSTLAAQYVAAALRREERAAVFLFDEVPDTFTVRGEGLGMRLAEEVRTGRLTLRQVNPAQLSPGEFADAVRTAVEVEKARIVVIDSLNGYSNAMPEEHFLSAHLHELLAYLNQSGVATVVVMAQFGILGTGVVSPMEISYLADTVVLLRYFEAYGEVRRAISVVKKRTGDHERTIRELLTSSKGLHVGETLREFQGVLTGQLSFTGAEATLMNPRATR